MCHGVRNVANGLNGTSIRMMHKAVTYGQEGSQVGDEKRHGYYVEGTCHGTSIAQARGRARHLANTFGRNVPITLVDEQGERKVAVYEPGGEVHNVTPGGKDGAKAAV